MSSESFEAYCYDLLQAGLDHIDQGITVFDKELRLVGWNRRFLDLLDMPPRLAFRGSDFSNIIRYNAQRGEYGPGQIEELVAGRVALAKKFEPHKVERVRPSGQTLSIRGEPLPEGGFVTVYTDVTERRRYERLIREQNEELERRVEERTLELQKAHDELLAAVNKQREIAAALRRNEPRQRLIIDSLPAGISYWDRELRCLFANKRFASVYNLTKGRIVGKRCRDVVGPEMMAAFADAIERARSGQNVEHEHEAVNAEGRTITVRTWLVPETGDHGELIGLFSLSLDITRQRQAETATHQVAKMDAIGQLSSGIAHDFNNLLTVVLGNLIPLRDQLAGDADQTEMLDPAIAAARNGAKLTERLLAFARRQPLSPAPVDVEGLVSGMVRLFRRSLPRSIEIVTEIRGRPYPALVDPHQLESALLNLAINARDAMPKGGELRFETTFVTLDQTESEASGVAPGEYVQITVADNGSGMDAETRAHVFEPFFTTKQGEGGSGLGLSMVYGFVNQSQGALRIESDAGKGTSVVILLPKSTEPAEQRTDSAPSRSMKARDSDLVLLVEDDDRLRAVVRRQLTDLGFKLVEARNAAEGLDLLESVVDFTIVVADIVMPGELSGLDLAERARVMNPDLSIVLMTGYAGGERLRDLESSPFPVLRKPFDRDQFVEALWACRSQ